VDISSSNSSPDRDDSVLSRSSPDIENLDDADPARFGYVDPDYDEVGDLDDPESIGPYDGSARDFSPDVYSFNIVTSIGGVPLSPKKNKKAQQVKSWMALVSSLVRPYLALLRETESLLRPIDMLIPPCGHCVTFRTINVVCVYMDSECSLWWTVNCLLMMFAGLTPLDFHTCSCSSIAEVLISKGLFPCAPILPSLAVDIKMLCFYNELSMRSAPNNTAWCDALESHLEFSKFKFKTKVHCLWTLKPQLLTLVIGHSPHSLWECFKVVYQPCLCHREVCPEHANRLHFWYVMIIFILQDY
jgi:hypothetical protein